MSAFSPAIREFLALPEDARRLGPYRCKELLDKAGSAPVFKADEEHAGLSLRAVAVKLFDIGKAKVGEKAEGSRVVDEARSLCRVQHPNVIRFHTLSTDPKRGIMGLVMEFAEGISVEKQLADLPPGDPKRIALAVEIGISISAALAAAHEANVVHCNVKPSNIMFTDGTHKLINFGIASSLRSAAKQKEQERRLGVEVDDIAPESIGRKASTLDKTSPGQASPIAGAIGYTDPVCIKTTSAPTASSDLYSLGVTLYQCLAGDVPAVATPKHKGANTVDAKVLLGETAPASIADVCPNAPAELAKIVDALVAPTREARPRSAEMVLRTLERIRSALAGQERKLPPEDRGPFPGLDRYEASDRDVFFGRSAEMAGILELARTRGLIGIVGLSGAGKSSITRAGVIPAIAEGALGGWPPKYRSVLVTPGNDLMGALRTALSKVIGAPLAQHPEEIAQQLSADVDAKGEGIVVLIDQLEEIVIKHDKKKDEDRLLALDLLSRLAEAHVGLRAVVVIRRDLLDEVRAIDPHFARALAKGIQLLSPLTSTAWEEVVDQALDAYGYSFEDAELRKDVLADLKKRESAMTLVQFGLTKLWAARDKKQKTITRSALSAKEGMQQALEQHADAAIAILKTSQDKVRQVLLAMTTPEGTRAHIELDKLVAVHGEEAKEVVFALTKARLVVSEKPGFTFVHDSLLKEWGLLRSWIESVRDDRLLSTHIERDAAHWEKTKNAAELWRKGRLAAGLELWKLGNVPLSDTAKAFLNAGHKEDQKVFYMRSGVAILIVSLIVGGALWNAKQSSERAVQARKDADALAAALAEVKALKVQTEENAMEAAESARLLADLRKQMADERTAYGAKVDTTLKRIASATSLDGAQKATEDLKGKSGMSDQPVVPINLQGLGSPSPMPKPLGNDPSPSPGPATFDQGSIERVVNARKAGVKRSCLERSAGSSSSTKVTATITIAPNGTVQNVSSVSDEPAVAKCIENQLRTWTFPAPGEPKTVQIPFVFVRQ